MPIKTTVTYITIIVSLNLVAFFIYSFTPAYRIKSHSQSIFYFRSFFLLFAVGFTAFGISLPKPNYVYSFFTNTCFLAGFYCLYFGFKVRKEPTKSLSQSKKYFFINWLLLTIVNVVLLTIYWDLNLVRTAILTSNCSLIATFTLKYIPRDNSILEFGEKIAFGGMFASVIFAMSLVLTLSITASPFIYLSLLVISQSVIAMLILGGTQAMLLSDLSKLYYEESVTDELTGLFNRRHFLRQTEALISSAERHKFPLALVLCDIDHFKQINDTYGHDVGDLALKEFSKILMRCCREEDVVARFGGEEFIFLLPQTDLEGAQVFAERARKQTEQHKIEVGTDVLSFTASFGVVSIKGKQETNSHIKQVDQALYEAKSRGRNLVIVFDEHS